jgi:hypothetical protein
MRVESETRTQFGFQMGTVLGRNIFFKNKTGFPFKLIL